MGNRATSKVAFFLTFIKKLIKKQLNQLVICYKLLMFFFPSDRKVSNQTLVGT